jgi:uncharacterized protein YndB with AHSA1/START domain
MTKLSDSQTAVLKLEIEMNASPERVWQSIITETASWWGPGFRALPNSNLILEAHIGGRLYEETVEGSGLSWGTVIGIDNGKSIDFAGHMTPAYAGPCITMVQFAVAPKGDGTLFTLTEGMIGKLSDETMESMKSGWMYLLGDMLKTYVERA